MGCVEVGATNPISQLIMSSLGDNYFPPYDLNFQPSDRKKLTEEKFLKMNTPGGGKFKPIGMPNQTHISEYLTPISGVLGSIFALFAPLYIILDVIRALIDIICALFNPIPLILTVVDLFINVLPPLIALYPPLSTILHAINAAKLITSIIGAIASSLIPIIVNVVDCALSIPAMISAGNILAVDSVGAKICGLLQEFANAIAGFGPISFILDMLELFLSLGAKFPCVGAPNGDSPCCTTENCPPIIINPPAGEGVVLHSIKEFNLKHLTDFIFGGLNVVLDPMTEWLAVITDVVNDFIGGMIGYLDEVISPTIDKITSYINLILENLNTLIFGPLSDFLLGVTFNDIIDLSVDNSSFSFASVIPTAPNVTLSLTSDEEWEDVIFVHPATYFEFKTATSQPNENGLVSQLGVGYEFNPTEMSGLQNFIIPPDVIPIPLPKLPKFLGGTSEDAQDPATIRVKLTKQGGEPVEKLVKGETKTFGYNTIGTSFDPIVFPGTTTVASGGGTFGKQRTAIEFLTYNGEENPLFVTEIPYVQDTLPQNFGEYMVDYENGAIIIFVGTEENPFTPTQYAVYGGSREVVMNYSYLSSEESKSVIASAMFEFPTLEQIITSFGLPHSDAAADQVRSWFDLAGFGYLPLDALGIMHIYDDTFDVDDKLEYEILPVQIELLKNNLIGLGCQNDIQSAAQSLAARINADIDTLPPGVSPLDPLKDKVQRDFPPPPTQELTDLLITLTDDPTTPVDPLPILNDYLEDLTDFVDEVVCVGVSSIQSEFKASKEYVLANGKDTSTISLLIKDQGGNNLLIGGLLPSSNFRAQFETTLGEIGPVEFDPDTGTFFAPISSTETGIADITAKFIVKDRVCSTISEFTDLDVKLQIVNVEFVAERTAQPRIRRQPQYIQSRGGRARR